MHCSFGFSAVFIQHWFVLLLEGILCFPVMSSQSPISAFFSFSLFFFFVAGQAIGIDLC